eukprot:CAMPEP_0114510202 /NCGR_PEP_ID=MMETSP0109-20121206/13648_1 /TAXON_ID=29199 /ORGANISM="Chlorarachnion reptans, Strain CCCM449" /LENGTH=745 /DNA_ID=CAMNT_0001689467 /DNA_START=126 /DNA_END=2363 /DNA_ORIENTATION=+
MSLLRHSPRQSPFHKSSVLYRATLFFAAAVALALVASSALSSSQTLSSSLKVRAKPRFFVNSLPGLRRTSTNNRHLWAQPSSSRSSKKIRCKADSEDPCEKLADQCDTNPLVREQCAQECDVSDSKLDPISKLRNIAIIAHVDHGKTTLVDKLLQQSGTLDGRKEFTDRVMDSNDLERERGITITSKNTAIRWKDYRINIVDTPGHADFGGEVERVMSMVDSVLLLVDAVEGPMPQTRFVTRKAFEAGLSPIVVVNKVDRDGARPDWVLGQVFDLFDELGATDEQLDFPIVYASGMQGIAGLEEDNLAEDMTPLFETLVDVVKPPEVDLDGAFQMQVTNLDYNSFQGAIAIGRVSRGRIGTNSNVKVVDENGEVTNARVLQIFGYQGLDRVEMPYAQAGDIVALTGIERPRISDTICDPEKAEALPPLAVDEPTVSMMFQVNDSPFAGKVGKYVTSRQIQDRLKTELIKNVALRVEPLGGSFKVSGRGELHLSVLLETMRREGYELAVSRPSVIVKEENGKRMEPYKSLVIECQEEHQGSIMEVLGPRKADMKNLEPGLNGRVRMEFEIPARGLIGFRQTFLTLTKGSGVMTNVFSHYGPWQDAPGLERTRKNGALVSMCDGKASAFALFGLQARGTMTSEPGDDVYEGQIVGINNRDDDMTVNPVKGKKLTNMRASGSDDAIILTPPRRFTLEEAIVWIQDDELVEITPENVRLRKKYRSEQEAKQAKREEAMKRQQALQKQGK